MRFLFPYELIPMLPEPSGALDGLIDYHV